jgi:hypothetical protein
MSIGFQEIDMASKTVKILAATAAAACVALAAATGPVVAAGPQAATPAATTASPLPQAATFTGEFLDGAPLYRLPPITGSTSRAAALAAIEQEDRRAAARSEPVTAGVFQTAMAGPATAAPDPNIELDVGLLVLGAIAAIGLSLGVLAGRRREAPTGWAPREWVAAQPRVPAPAPAQAARDTAGVPPAPRAAVSPLALQADQRRERRLANRRRAGGAPVAA